MDPCIALLRDLVSIDSVNPSLVPGAAGEGRIATLLGQHLRALGLDVHVEDVEPGRPNVVGVFEGGQPGRSLMFCGHLDTVGVDGMAAPFDPVEKDGRLYARGAQDMKGGVAAMIDAVRVLKARNWRRGRLIVAAVVDEEYASIGADALVKTWTADAAVVTEPTDLDIGVGHKGFAWFEIETHGRAAHGSRPREGIDAIVRMGRVLSALERFDSELQSRSEHAVMGTPSLHASIIEGGRELSSYPDRCRLQLERRTVAGETDASTSAEVRSILDHLSAADPAFRASYRLAFSRPPYEVEAGHALPSTLRAAAAATGCRSTTIGLSFWTDAAVLGAAGIPSVLFGPGGAGLHSTEEYVNVADVITCRDALVRLAEQWL